MSTDEALWARWKSGGEVTPIWPGKLEHKGRASKDTPKTWIESAQKILRKEKPNGAQTDLQLQTAKGSLQTICICR